MRKVDTTQIKGNICAWTKDHKDLIKFTVLAVADCFIWYTVGKVVQKDRDTISMQPIVNFTNNCAMAVPKGVAFHVHPFRNESIGKFNDMNRVIEILNDSEACKDVLGAVLFTK